MGNPGPASEVAKQDILGVFTQSDHPYTPFTTAEIAAELDCAPHQLRTTLDELADHGELHCKQIDPSTRIWWPAHLGEMDASLIHGPFMYEQLGAFINAVEEYAIFLLDPEGIVVSWNDGAKRIKGYDETEIVGKHFSTFYEEDAIAEGVPEQNLEAAAATGWIEDEGWRVRKDGTRFWANVTITAIRTEDGTLQGYVKVTRDMTERREYERQLQAQADQLERQRDELEQELDDVFERIDDAFYALDGEFRFTYVNDRAEEYIGKPAGELLGQLAWEVLDIDETDPIIEKYETAIATQEPMSFERYSAPLGLWIMVRLHPSESGLSVYFRNITERKERERELERSQSAIQTIQDGVYATDENRRFTMVNDAYVSMSAYDREELIGSPVSLVISDEKAEESAEMIDELLAGTKDVAILEAEHQRPNGEWFPTEARFTVITDEDGEFKGTVGVTRDMTARVQRERELRRYETLIEESADVNAVVNSDGELQYVTSSVEHVLGYPVAELIGENAFSYLHPDDREAMNAELAGLANDARSPSPAEFRFRHADGSWVWLEARGRNLQDDPTIDGIVIYTRDITDRKAYEQDLSQTVAKLEESNERLEQFAYVASHDLQEPLRMISSYLQLLSDRYADDLDADASEFIEFAVDGAERMREMIEDLLAYSRVDTQAESLAPTDCEGVVNEVLRNLQMQIDETDATIEVGSLPTVNADDNQLEQVLQNLVSNAIKYRGDEPPHIEISAERTGDEWVFRVTDNGIGIDPEHTDRIFEVFHRLHTRDEYPGTGIGLALCQKIIERHGGRIWAESEPEAGSTFCFTIPVSDTA